MSERDKTVILNVDDNASGRYATTRMLEHAGYDVIEAATGGEALEKVRAAVPDLVLLDVNLPDIDGFDVCRRIKETPSSMFIPVLHLSAAYTNSAAKVKGLDTGADGYLTQPVEPIVLVATINSLLRLKKAEEARRESEYRLQAILDQTPALVYVLDMEGRFTMVNRQLARILGQPQDAILGKTRYAFLPKETADQHRANDMEIALTAKAAIVEEINYEPDGQHTYLSVKSPLLDKTGATIAICGMSTDITDRKKVEAERERLMAAIEQAAEIVVVTDPAGTIEYVNPAFERVTGYSHNEVLTQNPRILKSDKQDAAFYRDLWATISSGSTWRGRIVNKHKNGMLYTEDATISPVRDASGRIVNYVAVKRDITHDLELEEQVRQSQKMDAIGHLAGGVAHDFNNILQAMIGYGDLLLDRLPKNEDLYEFASEIARGAERAAALTRQLLMFSRRQVMQQQSMDLNAIVENLLKMLRRLLGEDIRLKWIPGNLIGAIYADAGMMDQVLMNLCINARDAMSARGVLTIETQNVLIDSEYCANHIWVTPGRFVLLSISDTGCGMNKDTLDRIFEPFFTTKEPGKGTGLGLATVYGIVKQHKGMVNVYSELGKGTVFKIYLPLCERKAEEVSPIVEEPDPGGHETILLAEDDEFVRGMAVRILERAGYKVLEAKDGEEAVAVFKENPDCIALLLLDVVMPNLGGNDAFKCIRAIRPGVPALFTSGYSENAVHTNFVLHEGVKLIQKPYAPGVLLRRIRAVLDSVPAKPD
jgi:two-component system, cell cycle sensor histidine kinase and response regulator CckA